MGAEQVSGEVLTWLKTLPLAPEYHPTIQEFQDPISYIFKIEKEASQYGICKIVPPVPPLSKKSVVTNFNRSIASRSSLSQTQNPKSLPTFTTRQQQVGFFPRKQRPVQQSVWQSGEHYTIQQFEAKAKGFEKSYLKNRTKKVVSGLEIETLFWKANGARPISVEYANDMPGSAFGPVKERTGETGLGASNVGDTSWNMRAVSRSDGALLRFMKEEMPGVTSPMLYVAMMFSWFAWHVEDHDLHSLNYLHFGAGKTWYGVPRDAATAFEEVIRVHGYGEEINPLVTFQVLGEKTTVMSPEVLIAAGVPCCRLVQNAGEFVVTFPRAYHTGFSHGFNCGEASNIATPEWLRFAKDAAIRRAAVNYPPMVSHFQLLYDLALDLSSSSTSDTSTALRSSRLKDKKRGERENIVKELFVEDIMQNNRLLHTLGKGSKVVLLPQNPSERFARSSLHIGSRYNVKSSLLQRLSSSKEAVKPSKSSSSDYVDTKKQVDKRFITYYSRKSKLASTGKQIEVISCNSSDRSTTFSHSVETEREESTVVDGLSDRGMLSCVRCGIWPFACVAIMQPTESTSQYLMSTDFSFDNLLGLRGLNDESNGANGYSLKPNCSTGSILKDAPDGLYNQIETTDHCTDLNHSSSNGFEKAEDKDAEMRRSSALGLLALAYGNSSDSEEHDVPPHGDVCGNDSTSREGFCESKYQIDHCESPHRSYRDREFSRVDSDDSDLEKSYLTEGYANHLSSLHDVNNAGKSKRGLTFSKRPSDDSSMLHVFCLEHALELEQLLRPVGGVHIMLLCHPDFPIVERAAKLMAKEQEIDHYWHDTLFRIATKEDEEQIQLVLQREEETPKNGDWAVKLGINLYYSSILCRSPLYRKQMPYNSVIYNVFGCSTPSTSPKALGHWSSWQRKMFMAGKWCGKVWMSNQVHPFLVKQDTSEEEGRTLESRMKTEEKIVEISETGYKFGRSSAPRSARKRKSRFEAIPITKIKPQERETAESDSDDSVDVKSHQERKRNTWKGRRTMNKTSFSATEFADDNSEDSVDVGTHQEHKKNLLRKMAACRSNKKSRSWYMEMEDSEPDPFQGCRRSVRSQRFKGQAGSRDMEDSEPEDPKEHIEPQQVCRRSVRSLRFKGQIKFQGAFSSKQHESNSDTEMEDEPDPHPRQRVRKPRKDLDTDTLSKKSRGKIGVTREGPRMRLPVRAPASKEEEFFCDLEGCTMSFGLAEELALHKKNICPVEGCYKKFFSHKYLVQHRRVHLDVRPLKCPWKGCRMTFKWAWARTEHLRVHTGARPYVCKEPGCGQTFRFVSDFSRHKRKTGHSIREKGSL